MCRFENIITGDKMIKAMSYGAVLWDIADGEKHIGGCTLNLAAHLRKLGMQTYMYTKLGCDNLGDEAVREIEKLKVNTDFIQRDGSKNTGYAKIVLDQKKVPTYEFAPKASHEYIEVDEEQIERVKKEQIDLFCYGTYCQSGVETRENLKKLLEACKFPTVFCDINLRVSDPEQQMIENSIRPADILKLNEEEVLVLAKTLYGENMEEQRAAEKMLKDYGIRLICVTKGEKGCTLYQQDGPRVDVKAAVVDTVDTVGAGDAFGAAFLWSCYQGLSLEKCAENGNLLGGYVATQKGAIPEYTEEILRALGTGEVQNHD